MNVANTRRVFCAALGALLAACSTERLPPPGSDQPLPVHVSHELPGTTCRSASKAVRGALTRLGYEVVSVEQPEPGVPGEIRAERRSGWTGEGEVYHLSAIIACGDAGASLQVATEEPLGDRVALRRDLPGEVDAQVARRARHRSVRDEAPARGLIMNARILRQGDARRAAGAGASSMTIVHIEILNRTDETYELSVDRVQLVTQEGTREQPLVPARMEELLGPDWAAEAARRRLQGAEIPPGERLEGLLYFPPAAYREAKIVVVERESQESEGFSVRF